MNRTFQQSVTAPWNLIIVTAILGTVGTIYGISLSNPYAKTLPPLVTLGAIVAAVAYRRSYSLPAVSLTFPKRPLLSLYLIFLTLVVGTFALTPGYGRTFPTHVLLLCLYLLTVLVIFNFDSGPFNLSVLLTTGLVHRALIYYGSATQLGLDALFHTRMAGRITATGNLEPLAAVSSKYWYSPLFHLVVSTTEMLSGIPTRDAAFVGITVITTVIPVLVVYSLLSDHWGERVSSLGAFLFVVADRSISAAVHVTPTTLGIVLFSLALFATVRYLKTGDWPYYGLFSLVILAQTFNHQVSLFVTIVGVGSYAFTHVLWSGRLTKREVALAPALLSAGLYQAFMTKLNGPSGEITIGEIVVQNFERSLQSGGGAAVSPPELSNAVVASTSSLGLVHVLGLAFLFGTSVLGAIYWITKSEEDEQTFVLGLCGTAFVLSLFAFVPPLIGVNVVFSLRWFRFLYLCLAVLAAPGFAILLSWGITRPTFGRRKQAIALVLAVLVVVAPYTALMTWNYPGAVDGPVFEDSPGSQRLTSTSTEAATYTHIDTYESGATAVFADKVARQMIERHYGHPAANYQVEYGNSHPVQNEDVLIVDRAYSRTKHAQYFINYEGKWFQVYGPLPVDRPGYSVVYSAGDDRVLYRG